MASKQIQCEMCCNENAVGYCNTCGYVGETCVDIHKTVKVFQTHSVIIYEAVKKHSDSSEILNVKLRDITDEKCEQHPTERVIFLCNIHDSMICGRCLHSEHIPCAKEVVDLLHEVVSIDPEKVNTMKSLLMEVKDEILLLKDEAEHYKENYNENVDKCMQECMELGNKIKRRVDELTSDIRDDITKKGKENLTTHSCISMTCDEKTRWCDNEESKIDDFVDKNMAGHFYLMQRHFEKEVSDVRSHLKEIKHKHTFKVFDFKENKVILKCLFEDLEEVCEQREEVTGSDDGNASDVIASTSEISKTRRELTVLLNQVKQDLDESEKARTQQCDELKQKLDSSEKKRKELCDELKQVNPNLTNSEKETEALGSETHNNIHYVSAQDIERGQPGKTVDFAPEHDNLLVTTAVNATGQAYITAKNVFKTWQDRQDARYGKGKKFVKKNQKPKQNLPGERNPASAKWNPHENIDTITELDWNLPGEKVELPTAAEFKLPKSEWKPPQGVERIQGKWHNPNEEGP